MSNYLIESMLSYGGRIDESCGKKKKKLTESVPIANEYEVATVFWPDAGESVLRVWEDTDGDFWWADEWGTSEHEFASLEDAIDDYKFNYSGEFDSIRMTPDYDYLDESLTEARNPENDEINAALRKWANDGNLTAKEKALIRDRGITLPNRRSSGYKSSILGKNRAIVNNAKNWVKNAHPDTDFANALEKPRIDSSDVESPTGKYPYWDKNPYRDNHSFLGKTLYAGEPDGSKMSPNQFRTLQPYAHEKGQLDYANRRIDREKHDIDYVNRDIEREKDKMAKAQANIKKIEKDKNKIQNRIDDINNTKKSIVDQAKERHTSRKNESLSLKEGLRGSNLWGELFDKAYEYIYEAIWDTLQSIDWLDDDEIDMDDIFVSELSQQLASELCDTVDDRFGEIITR